MDWLENELRSALQREDAPHGFAEKAIVRTRRRAMVVPPWLAAAAALILVAGGTYGYRLQRGMEAKHEVLLALRMASAKVSHVQAVVREKQR